MRRLLLLCAALLALPASAGEYRLELGGQDVADAGAWRTFNFALPRLRPGDTLQVGAGEWSNRDGGLPYANCETGAFSGDAGAPITVRGASGRKTVVSSDGTTYGMGTYRCAHWAFEEFLIKVSDGPALASDGVSVAQSSDISLRHLTVQGNNRALNSSSIAVVDSPRSQVTECEVYDFSIAGVLIWTSPGSAARRNYVNSRNRVDGTYPSTYPARGDVGIYLLGTDVIAENNISENNASGFLGYAYSVSSNLSFRGNVSLDDYYGVITSKDSSASAPQNTVVTHHLAVRPVYVGAYFRSSAGTRCENCSMLDTLSTGFSADRVGGDATMAPLSTTITRSVATGRDAGEGVHVVAQASFAVSEVWLSNYPLLTFPGGSGFSGIRSGDAGLGACRVYAPPGSALFADDGGTLGATVLEVSIDGGLTGEPLWNPQTGQWRFCGPIIAGVNDLDGGSCFDVHLRLNVGPGGCPLPAGYGQDAGADAGTDGGVDAGADAGVDGGSDGGDGGVDGGFDAGADAGSDGGVDGGADGGSDAGGPTESDAGVAADGGTTHSSGPLAVGCGCRAPAGEAWFGVLVALTLLAARRRFTAR